MFHGSRRTGQKISPWRLVKYDEHAETRNKVAPLHRTK